MLASTAFLIISLAPALASADALVDPTRPYNAVVKTVQLAVGMHVSAIMQAGGRRVAVVDGQLVKSGDRVGESVIEEVLIDGVRYKRAGKIEYARLPSQAMQVRHSRTSGE